MKTFGHSAIDRRAFSLIELVVAIAIIGILMAILLPAVQQAREAARKIQCSNNLRQQGLALQLYHDAWKTFPMDVLYGQSGVSVNANVRLLPYLDQESIHELLDPGQNLDSVSAELAKQRIAILDCPSDATRYPFSNQFITDKDGPYGDTFGLTSYGLSKGVNDSICSAGTWASFVPYQITSESGLFTHTRSIRMADVLDGLSNTFAIGEAAGGKPICVGIGCTERHPKYGAETPWFMNFNWWLWYGEGFVFSGIHCSTVEPLNKYPVTDSLMAGPAELFDCTGSLDGGPHRVSNFRSSHPGGGFFLYADGRVKWIDNGMAMPTYRAMSTIQGGDLIRKK